MQYTAEWLHVDDTSGCTSSKSSVPIFRTIDTIICHAIIALGCCDPKEPRLQLPYTISYSVCCRGQAHGNTQLTLPYLDSLHLK
jgi:hypothetical protein